MHTINDALDGYIVAAAMDYYGISEINDIPSKNKPSPLLYISCKETQQKYLEKVAAHIVEEIVLTQSEDIGIRIEQLELQLQEQQIKERDGYFCCTFSGCDKNTKKWLA